VRKQKALPLFRTHYALRTAHCLSRQHQRFLLARDDLEHEVEPGDLQQLQELGTDAAEDELAVVLSELPVEREDDTDRLAREVLSRT
jgi:hypothetical protein